MLLRDEWQDYDLVFCTEIGTPLDQSNLYERVWIPLIEEAKVPRIPRHSLRHGFATMMLEAGVDPKILSELLGHYSVAFTMDTYVHPDREAKKRAMDTVASWLPNTGYAQDMPKQA